MNEFLFNTFTWTIIGFIVAYIAHLTNSDGKHGSVLSTITFGLVGAFLGGTLANIFLGKTIVGVSVPGLLLALFALLFLAILQTLLLRRRKDSYDSYTFIR